MYTFTPPDTQEGAVPQQKSARARGAGFHGIGRRGRLPLRLADLAGRGDRLVPAASRRAVVHHARRVRLLRRRLGVPQRLAEKAADLDHLHGPRHLLPRDVGAQPVQGAAQRLAVHLRLRAARQPVPRPVRRPVRRRPHRPRLPRGGQVDAPQVCGRDGALDGVDPRRAATGHYLPGPGRGVALAGGPDDAAGARDQLPRADQGGRLGDIRQGDGRGRGDRVRRVAHPQARRRDACRRAESVVEVQGGGARPDTPRSGPRPERDTSQACTCRAPRGRLDSLQCTAPAPAPAP
eukprot:5405180-Prymnesium_polylepis.1